MLELKDCLPEELSQHLVKSLTDFLSKSNRDRGRDSYEVPAPLTRSRHDGVDALDGRPICWLLGKTDESLAVKNFRLPDTTYWVLVAAGFDQKPIIIASAQRVKGNQKGPKGTLETGCKYYKWRPSEQRFETLPSVVKKYATRRVRLDESLTPSPTCSYNPALSISERSRTAASESSDDDVPLVKRRRLQSPDIEAESPSTLNKGRCRKTRHSDIASPAQRGLPGVADLPTRGPRPELREASGISEETIAVGITLQERNMASLISAQTANVMPQPRESSRTSLGTASTSANLKGRMESGLGSNLILENTLLDFGRGRVKALTQCNNIGRLFAQARAAGLILTPSEEDTLVVTFNTDPVMAEIYILRGDVEDFKQLYRAISRSTVWEEAGKQLLLDVMLMD